VSNIYAEAMKAISGVGNNEADDNNQEELIESDDGSASDLEEKLKAAIITSKSLGQTRVTVKLNKAAGTTDSKILDQKKAL
jgi:hypothetical protein